MYECIDLKVSVYFYVCMFVPLRKSPKTTYLSGDLSAAPPRQQLRITKVA